MGKILKISAALKEVKRLKNEGKRIVLAGGCFDILHLGHINFLENARKQGDVLVLILESDIAIRNLKGENRPINSLQNRAKVLAAISFVDVIIALEKVFKTPDYDSLINKIVPDVIAVTRGDPNFQQKKLQAEKVHGSIKEVVKKLPEHSTTKLWKILNDF